MFTRRNTERVLAKMLNLEAFLSGWTNSNYEKDTVELAIQNLEWLLENPLKAGILDLDLDTDSIINCYLRQVEDMHGKLETSYGL